jgi:hypothetical protein
MIIAIDFDGTCVEHAFPKVGKDVPGAETVLKALVSEGHQLILWTMRSDGRSEPQHTVLRDAIDWFHQKGIPLYAINANPDQIRWTSSPKAYADIYIDDAALGCPVRLFPNQRAYVDWRMVAGLLVERGVLKKYPRFE